MSNLIDHAEFELRRAGLFDKDSDYHGMIGESVMTLVRALAGKGHSGHSADMTLAIFNEVANYKALTPITSNPSEWNDVSAMSGPSGPNWQNKRQSSCFSDDGGKTYYDICADDKDAIITSADPT